jgi:hypothetical protein
LSEAERLITVGAVSIIMLGATGATALRAGTIPVFADLAYIALLSRLYCVGIFLCEFQDIGVALAIILRQRPQYHCRNLYRNASIPLLWRRR